MRGYLSFFRKRRAKILVGAIPAAILMAAGLYVIVSDRQDNLTAAPEGDVKEHTNRLIQEKSPYLQQHAHNPVDWYPWGDEAIQRARTEDKPIFLSVGYASCHWCHVMERESFENEEIATILNQHFISIKVDREERPDLDHIYMTATTLLAGRGGWPMSVFLTADLKPFFAGTYFPPDDRYGRPGFKRLIIELANAYETERTRVQGISQDVYRRLQEQMIAPPSPRDFDKSLITAGADQLLLQVDTIYGGFGTGAKFPQATQLSLLLRQFKSTGDSTY